MEAVRRQNINPTFLVAGVVTKLPYYIKHGQKNFKHLLEKDIATFVHHYNLFKKNPNKHSQKGSPLTTAIWTTLNKNDALFNRYKSNLESVNSIVRFVNNLPNKCGNSCSQCL